MRHFLSHWWKTLHSQLNDRVLPRLRNGSFLSSVLILASGTGLGQLIIVLATPILTRLYNPADFGVLTVFVSALALLLAISSLRYDNAIPLPDKQEVAVQLMALAMLIVLGASIAAAVAILFFGDMLVTLLSASQLAPFLWLLPAGLLVGGWYRVLNFWHIRKKHFKRLTQAKIGQSASLAGGQMVMGVLAWGPFGLVGGYVLGQLTAAVILMRELYGQRSLWNQIDWAGMKITAKRYKRFPLISSWSALLNSASLQLPPLLFAALFGAAVAGWFGLAQRVAGIPITLIGRSVSQVYLSEASRVHNKSPRAMRRLFWRTASRLFLFVGLPLIAGGLTAPWLFGFIFGQHWRTSGFYIVALLPMFVGQSIVTPLSQTLNILERQDLQLIWDASRIAVVISAIGSAHYIFQFSPLITLMIYGIIMFVMYLILFLMMWRQVGLLYTAPSSV